MLFTQMVRVASSRLASSRGGRSQFVRSRQTRSIRRAGRISMLVGFCFILGSAEIGLSTFGFTTVLRAHDGLHIDIENLTAQIDALATPRADLFLVRSRLFRAHEKPTEALADCDRAKGLLADDSTSLLATVEQPLERALVLIALERSAEALALLDSVIEIAGDRYVASLDARAQIHRDAGRFPVAIADAARAFRGSPTPERALRWGAWLVEARRLDEASAAYRESIERLGGSRLVRNEWISVEIARGEYESALAMIEAELERAVVRTVWLLRRAEVYEAAGNGAQREVALRAALAEANRVLERRRMPVYLVMRGEVYLTIGDLDAALRDAEEARAAAPEFPKLHELLTSIAKARAKVTENRLEGSDPAPPESETKGGEKE